MAYYFTKTLTGSMQEVDEKVRAALKEKGFGVLTEIDVTATFKKKIDKEIYPYRILGACNPNFAFDAIHAEDKIGVMLPCNVILQEKEAGTVEVSAVDPMSSMQAVENPNLGNIATEVQSMLKTVIDTL